MNFNKLLNLASYFLKLSSYDAFMPSSKEEALNILNITPNINLTPEIVNKSYKLMVAKNHPDKGGDAILFKKIIAAKDYLLKIINNLDQDNSVGSNQPFEDLSYEDIAQMRQEMGRQEFDQKFPGWISELKQEMGLDEYNKIFEGYNPSYRREDDLDYIRQQENLIQIAEDIISDAIDLDDFESKIESLTTEEKLFLLNNLNNSLEFLDIFNSLGLENPLHQSLSEKIEQAIKNNKDIFENLSLKETKKIKENVAFQKMKNLIKLNSDLFSEILSLEDIIKNSSLTFLFDKGLHLSKKEINKLLSDDFNKFLQMRAIEKSKNSHLSKYDLNMLPKIRQCHYLAGEYVEFKKHLGDSLYLTQFLVSDIFGGIQQKYPEIFENLLNISNPITYKLS